MHQRYQRNTHARMLSHQQSTIAAAIILAAATLTNLSAHAQAISLDWAASIGGNNQDRSRGIGVDSAGNVYTTGDFRLTVDFDPSELTSFEITSAGSADIYVNKYSANGAFVWARSFPGTGLNEGWALALDPEANVYTTGDFTGTADFDPGPGTFELTSIGTRDIYVSKLDTNGNFVWAVQFGGTRASRGQGIAVDDDGNVYITGFFQDTVDFDPGPETLEFTSTHSHDTFIVKLNTSGELVWARQLTNANNGVVANGIAVDHNGNVYTAGSFTGTVDFNPGPQQFNVLGLAAFNIYLHKLNADGVFQWVRTFGESGNNSGRAVTVDPNGNVYLTGTFWGAIDFDPGLGETRLTSGGVGDIFVCRFNTNGNLTWARRMGGAGGAAGTSIAVDAFRNVYTGGGFGGEADFDPGPGEFLLPGPTTSGSNYFVSKLDALGEFRWAISNAGGLGHTNQAHSIAVGATGSVHVAGAYGGTVDFDPGPGEFELRSPSTGMTSGFAFKILQDGNTGVDDETELEFIQRNLAENFDDLDANGDGGLSLEEARALFPELLEFGFNQLDTNGDGLLQRSELQTGREPLCDLLPNVDSRIADFYAAFGINDDGLTDLAGEGLPDRYALALVEQGGCTIGSLNLMSATDTAYSMNLGMIESLGMTPIKQTNLAYQNRNIIAALALTSDAMAASLTTIIADSGLDTTGLEFAVVECGAGECMPQRMRKTGEIHVFDSAYKQMLNQPYSANGDFDGDGDTNREEFDNVRAAGGGILEFIAAATDPQTDGSTGEEGEEEDTPRGGCGATPNHANTPGDWTLVLLVMTALIVSRKRLNASPQD